MKRTNGKHLIRVFSLVFSIILLLSALVACKGRESGAGPDVDFDIVSESPFGYTPVLSSTRVIQMGKDHIYFAGTTLGIFKYDIVTGEVSEICTDPMCAHNGANASCRIAGYTNLQFFRAFSNILIYTSITRNDANQTTPHLYGFEPQTMKNVLIDDKASTSNQYCLSDKYVYFNNITVKDGVNYFNHRQVSIADGSERIFGDETEGTTPYKLIGAINGYLYAQDKDSTATYICPEDDPGNFKLFWEQPISNIWAGEDDLFFRSRDPENDDGKYYFYHTDIDGNVIKRQELVGGMKWCSFYDGRHLYYIPADETTFINNDEDRTVKNIHWREMYCLDMETGERTVAFTFNGDYETLELGFSLGNDMIVLDGKIYTYRITQARGYIDEETNQYIIGGPEGFSKGIAIIDMKTGDVTHVTADYSRKGEFSTKTEYRSMRIEGEPESEETTLSVETEAPETPEVIVLDKSLMFSDTNALPLFRARDYVSKTPSRYEVYDANGKIINLCYCGATPCTCGNNDRMIVCGNIVYTMGESGGGKTVFHAYDASDRNNIKHSSVTVEGFDTETHNITISSASTSYFFVRPKEGDGSLRIVDMTDAINGNVKVKEYSSLVGAGYIIHISNDSAIYCTMTDKSGNVKVIKAEAGKSAYTELFEIKLESESVSGYNLILGSDGALHVLRDELDDKSKYGYSLYQYTYREGKAIERVLRAKNVCDFIVSGEYFYYTVNTPANSRQFVDRDHNNRTYNDMTGGIIFRQSIEDTNAAHEAVWSVGDYYLYGFTPNNKPEFSGNQKENDLLTFIQSTEGGIALGANKAVDGDIQHVWLLIGNTESGVVMTEIQGANWWGISFVGGGSGPNNQTNLYEVIEDEG